MTVSYMSYIHVYIFVFPVLGMKVTSSFAEYDKNTFLLRQCHPTGGFPCGSFEFWASFCIQRSCARLSSSRWMCDPPR